jgi:hypothetical protein
VIIVMRTSWARLLHWRATSGRGILAHAKNRVEAAVFDANAAPLVNFCAILNTGMAILTKTTTTRTGRAERGIRTQQGNTIMWLSSPMKNFIKK